MKKIMLIITGTMLLIGGVVGIGIKTNADKTPMKVENVKTIQSDTEQGNEIEDDFTEYAALDEVVNLDNYTIQVAENNSHKRILLLENENGQSQFKSIYVKNTDRLKVIDFDKGLIFNQILGDWERNNRRSNG